MLLGFEGGCGYVPLKLFSRKFLVVESFWFVSAGCDVVEKICR